MDKIFLNLAGKFLVAAELNRRHILSSVGPLTRSLKPTARAAVLAFSAIGNRVVRVEVHSTKGNHWPVGGRGFNTVNTAIWVLVCHPPRNEHHQGQHAPRFFVLTGAEVSTAARANHETYSQKYQAKHGIPYPKTAGRHVVTRSQAAEYEGAWGKIAAALRG